MDVIKAMSPLMEEIGCEVHVKYLPERAFDVKANVLDSTKLLLHTGWKPQVEFDDGLRRTREWLRREDYG
jgi:UDP-glucose 4-epimerase